jgi:enoyl-CoA hydratase
MQYEHLLVDDREGIVLVTLNRPRALNAINSAMMEELRLLFSRDLREHHAIRGVIVTGTGDKAFAAGADITELLALTPGTVEAFVRKGHEAYNAIERFPRPVIAAIDGYALGGGCELAMACHLRVATPQSRFGQPEVNLGIIPGYGGTQRLVQLIGKARALELLMTGDLIDAETALRYGLINDLVGPGEAINKATDLIGKISTKGPLAVEKIITTVQAYYNKNDNGFDREIQGFCDLSATEDFREGSAAFLEKRKANFAGK